MRAVVIDAAGSANLREVAACTPGPGEVLVRCQAAAICTVERQLFSGARQSYPAIGGHEVAGVIVDVAAPEDPLRPGDRVVLDAVIRCGRCHYCLKGLDHLCTDLRKGKRYDGAVRIGGGFAEYTTAPSRRAVRIPDHLGFEEASLIEPLACCVHSLHRAGAGPGETVAVVGAGTMGALHVLLARALGCRTIALDVIESRLRAVDRLGADVLVNAARNDAGAAVKDHTEGRGAEAVVVTAPDREAGEQALALAAPAGRVVLFASCHPSRQLTLDWNRVHYSEITVTGSAGKTVRDFYEAVQLVASRRLDLRPLVLRTIRLADLPEELGAAPNEVPGRVVVRHETAAPGSTNGIV
jgi:L-iditol 2-dehydrogenase